MASATILDFDRLLAPISDDNPCGADLRWDNVYQQIKDARPKEDRSAFELDNVESGSWSDVLDLTTEALAGQTKDLMIAAWLTESLVHLYGFAGCRDGLKLVNDLLDQYWDGVYPLPDDGDLETRAAPLVFLTADGSGAKLPNLIREAPLTSDRDESYSLNYYRARMQRPGEKADAFAQRAAEVEEKTRLFDDAVGRMSIDFARNVLEDMEQAKAELARLNANLDSRFGDASPATTALRTALEECHHRMRIIVKDKGGLDVGGGDNETDDTAGEASNGQSAGAGGPVGPIKSREEAFRRLAEVAVYLRQKEPQNPIYLLVERAVRWSRMPFEQLLGELVKDHGARGQVEELLGFKPPSSDES